MARARITRALRGVSEIASAYYRQLSGKCQDFPSRRNSSSSAPAVCKIRSGPLFPLRIGCECPNNGLSPITRQGSENFTHIVTSGLGHPSGTDAPWASCRDFCGPIARRGCGASKARASQIPDNYSPRAKLRAGLRARVRSRFAVADKY